ncbi:HTH-type transcriptional regulator immR [Acholeplasma oculi]|nr:helix-turn-helix transcriptional regulator [Acholeplasma oculi]SKC36567.1 DNA-binding transcriptional regulator, XRE-family HTH domain [Acholeplasma oculi]SUT90575.1 HTH-type transcriptional regulator immR [Acholeplasma oculi]
MLKIKEYRKKVGMTQQELASKLEMSQNAVSLYERGVNDPSILTLVQIAEQLGITVDELIDYQKIKNKLSEDLDKRVEKRIEESRNKKK